MAKKKIYAVRKGHKTGLFETWAECQKATSGYSGAEFRGFTDREEAMAFLQMSTTANVSKDEEKEAEDVSGMDENSGAETTSNQSGESPRLYPEKSKPKIVKVKSVIEEVDRGR